MVIFKLLTVFLECEADAEVGLNKIQYIVMLSPPVLIILSKSLDSWFFSVCLQKRQEHPLSMPVSCQRRCMN